MKFSYSAVWEDTVTMIRGNASLIAALAGVFLFLPALLIAYFLPPPQTSDPAQLWPLMVEYFSANLHWFVLANLVNMVGAITILLLLFGRGGATVGGVIIASFGILPFYFIAALLSGLAVAAGLVLLIVPGLYLLGRLAPIGAIVVAENRRNPVDAMRRSFELTKGRGWAVLGLIVIVGIAGAIVVMVVNLLFGLLFMVAGERLGEVLSLIVEALTGAALSTVLIVLFAAIYRRLADGAATAST